MKLEVNKLQKIHFIGIGGTSMSGIAEIVKNMGYEVSGSDRSKSKLTQHLEDTGIKVCYGHHPEMVLDADIIVYTAAIPKEDPERLEGEKQKKKMYERKEFLGKLMLFYQHRLCVSGTHGKSSTTGFLVHIFLEAKKEPTIQIGAILPKIKGTSYVGQKEFLILEACEYVDSFLQFHPTGAIITNIDNDHLDYFHDLKHIQESFQKYTTLIPENGVLIKNNDDINSKEIGKNCKAKLITIGIQNQADYQAVNIVKQENGCYSFTIIENEKPLLNISLHVIGYHQIYNALCAFALAYQYISDKEIIKMGIENYQGIERRFEYIGELNQVKVYDDYAHHPTEIKTTYETSLEISHHQTWAIFEPHTYSRTKEHLEEFAHILAKFDHIIISTIYGAREVNTFDVSEAMLVEKIKEENPHVIYLETYDKIINYIKENVKKNDMVITIGAGPIRKVSEQLTKKES